MGLIEDTTAVFEFFGSFFSAFPVAVQLLITGVFGGMILIAVMRNFWG